MDKLNDMPDLTVSLLQAAPFWEDIPRNLDLFGEKIRALKKEQIVVLPEMFNTGFSMNAKELAEKMDGPTVQWMKILARQQAVILTGSLIIEEKGHYFNRQLWVLPNGAIAYYDKRHLFSYAGEDQYYTAGKKRLVAQVKGWKIGLFICYDLRFPAWMRQGKEPGARYDLLIIGANWPDTRIAAWDTLLKARAIENQCFVAGVNRIGRDGYGLDYNGHSAFYDPLGNEIQGAGNRETCLQQVLKKEIITSVREKFPFLDDADGFTLQT